MATRNIVPRANGEGSLGTNLKRWLSGFFRFLNIDQYIDFTNISNPSYQEGRLFYDNVEHTVSLYNEVEGIVHNLGQEHLTRVKNETGVTLLNGKVVRIIGANGTGHPTVELAIADTEEHATVLGLLTHSILDGNYGYACVCGKIHGLDTSMYIAGDILYLSPTIPGGLTTVKPSIVTIIGRVMKVHVTEGIIYCFPKELGVISADMLKSVYDINDNEIVDKAESLDDGTYSATAEDVEDAVTKKHEHTNKTELDLITDGEHDGRTDNPHNVTKTQVGLGNVPDLDTSNPSNITQDSSHRFVTDTEKSTWNSKQDAIGFTPEDVNNKRSSFQITPDDTHYPSEKLVKDNLDGKVDKSGSLTQITTRNHSDLQNKDSETNVKHVTDNQKNALDNANFPTTSNPVITKNDIKYYYGESLGESSTTSAYSSYINKLTLALVSPLAGDYILEWDCLVANSGAGGDTWTRVIDNLISPTIFEESRVNCAISYANSGWSHINGFRKVTLDGSNISFLIDFCRQTNTAYTKSAKILLRRII